MTFQPPIPLLRSFDETKARHFYIEWLGFTVDWEHRFAPEMPLYLQISRGACVLHLTEHHGDCTPGSKVFIHTDDLQALHDELHSKPNPNMRPSILKAPWEAKVLEITIHLATHSCLARARLKD